MRLHGVVIDTVLQAGLRVEKVIQLLVMTIIIYCKIKCRVLGD
jgi:hypothetical protein